MHPSVQNLIKINKEIESNFKEKNQIPKIIAVSKTFGMEKIRPLIEHGHTDFGENKVQEALEKWKKELLARVNKISSHSQIGKVTTALDFITNLDLSSISYPTSDIAHKLKMDNKYVDLRCI